MSRSSTLVRVLLIFVALYLFMVGISAMGGAFKILGRGYVDDVFGAGASPFLALFVGILATTLVQSSSVTTSLVVGAVGGGGLSFDLAVFMIMGANLGTTVTNTIVSLGHITRSGEYKRAFAAATVHDFFNMLALVIIFPLEIATGVLSRLATALGDAFTGSGEGGKAFESPVKLVVEPVVDVLEDLGGGSGGWLLAFGVVLTFSMLVSMVRLLRKLMLERAENLFDRVIFKTPLRSLTFGAGLTVVVQSSSITTSVAVPLVGAGVITIEQIFPYTLGANIGTTSTSLLAFLGSGASDALKVAFFHVLFNVAGVLLIWWIRWLPILIANRFAELALWNRALPIFYIILVFYVLPILVTVFGR